MIERLALCFDGTWNTPEDQTNVSRLFAAIADESTRCGEQLKFYDAGVGTTVGSKLSGGLVGFGLDRNILEGYAWLANVFAKLDGVEPEHYEHPKDGEKFVARPKIFIFGFSRGAFTARSLAGLINRCGVPRSSELEPGKRFFDADSRVVKDAWALYRTDFGKQPGRDAEPCRTFRAHRAWNAEVECLAVWDTVGALGIPWLRTALLPVSPARQRFHDVALGRVVKRAYHAVAIDEYRKDYEAALWTSPHPIGTEEVEQRWFPGAHSNVGGGYEDDLLCDPPLRWIAKCALRLGLEFIDEAKLRIDQAACRAALPSEFELAGDEYLAAVRDSYGEFMFGAYKALRAFRGGRHYRHMLTTGVGESIDESALLKWKADPRYRPRNLAAAGRADL